MLASISYPLFCEWIAYGNLEPYGPIAAYHRSGIIATVIANLFRGKGRKGFSPADFIPKFRRQRPRKQTPAQMNAIFATWAEAKNANRAGRPS